MWAGLERGGQAEGSWEAFQGEGGWLAQRPKICRGQLGPELRVPPTLKKADSLCSRPFPPTPFLSFASCPPLGHAVPRGRPV